MAKSKSSNSRSKVKTIVFKSDFMIDAPPKIFSDVEREIILADMAYLKQKEIDSGDWAKWEKDQAKWKDFNALRAAGFVPPAARPDAIMGEIRRSYLDRDNVDEWGAVKDCDCARCVGVRRARR